ncbi:uncharacterized protein [Rutidosis leptorrhynchoides]|uniref:uncharacterized protein n=1 Tax=Rutidosis leptorrhynchoides TaxID=125765 RepID=UPI003A995283
MGLGVKILIQSKKLLSTILRAYSSSKAPGPDGFNFGFFKKFWSIIKEDLGWNKVRFLGGRYILDGALVANEVVEDLKRNKKHGLIFKVDFEKAFDSLNLDYLLEVMKCMGFGTKWCKWISSCLKSATISILINGSPTSEFNLKRGVRQGDPLSPFLFIIAAEGLNILTKMAVERGMYKGVEVGKDKVVISHLQYADDTIFFCEWSRRNARNLMYLLECFERASGLKVNYNKSQLFGIGISNDNVEALASWCSCLAGRLPFMYLGIPVGNKMKKLNDWFPVIEKFNKRLVRKPNASLWNSICFAGKHVDGLGISFSKSFIRVIGDGNNTSFWDDIWQIEDKKDCWNWNLNSKGTYTVKDCSFLVDKVILRRAVNSIESLRNGLVPKKVEVFIWRARLGRLLVRFELDKRGIDLNSVRCPICDGDIETVEHILFSCQMAKDIWAKVLKWWGYNSALFGYEDIFNGTFGYVAHDHKRNQWQAVCWVVCYILWKNRNAKVFKNKLDTVPSLFNEVQVLSYDWISRRCKGHIMDWLQWFSHP